MFESFTGDRRGTAGGPRRALTGTLTLIRQEPHGIPGEGNGDSMRPTRQPAATHPNSG